MVNYTAFFILSVLATYLYSSNAHPIQEATLMRREKWVPPSELCLKKIIPEAKACDIKYRETDKFCSQGYINLKKECGRNDSLECGAKYAKFGKLCKSRQAAFHAECDPKYDQYIFECATAMEAAEDAKEVAEIAVDN